MNVLVLGAGQLARMMALATKPLNINIRAYDVTSSQVVDPLAPALTFGDLAKGIAFADVITAEFEHIDQDTLAACEVSGKLKPSSTAIKTGGDRRLEKQLLEKVSVANAPHYVIQTKADFDQAIKTLSLPVIFKSALDGYDGKGQWRLKSTEQADAIWQEMASFISATTARTAQGEVQGIIAEQMIPFSRELSMVGVRDINGNTAAYPLTENHHSNGILSVSVACADTSPAQQALQKQASDAFNKIANALDYVGVLAIEFFQVGDKLLVNELAPRVHNSGHWTQQGSHCSQFENHIRAVAGLPLGCTALIRPTAMVNILGQDQVPNELLAMPDVSIHWYGKTKRAGRKMGHINISGNDISQLQERLFHLLKALPAAEFAYLTEYLSEHNSTH